MGIKTDVIIFGVASADASNSIVQGFDPVGYAGTSIAVASNAAQLAASGGFFFGVAAPQITAVATITSAITAAGGLGAC